MADNDHIGMITSKMVSGEVDRHTLEKEKRRIARLYKTPTLPSNITLMSSIKSDDIISIKEGFRTKPMRSASGVSVIAVMTEPRYCPHGKCIYCPGGPKSVLGDVPMAYTGREPASMRGSRLGYDSYLQVFTRLEQYVAAGHNPQKIELIIMGGTLPSYEESYQDNFVNGCFKAMNDFGKMFAPNGVLNHDYFNEFFELPGSLDDDARFMRIIDKLAKLRDYNSDILRVSHEKNETAYVRCIGMTIETRPDFAYEEHALKMLSLGATRVEVGVQSVYDHILEYTGRSHGTYENIKSTKILKDGGFKINYHLMPGLPGVSYDDDLKGLIEVFNNPDYRPDMIKIYPTGVFPGTVLHDYYMMGAYKPLRTDDAIRLLSEFKPHVPEYCRIMRIQRDIPSNMLVDGVLSTNLRQLVHDEMQRKGVKCRCIRCREAGLKRIDKNDMGVPIVSNNNIKVMEYDASCGKEFFISMEYDDMILGFVRLRFLQEPFHPAIRKGDAMIRELHVYGVSEPIGIIGSNVQHRGIGRMLMLRAEEIAKNNGYTGILVISGVGVRQYYKSLGYRFDNPYMRKEL
ncbi:MAG: tRNA uridine(34) 5-carboxymethylaminomethyl modification radical SAM/GNAT enzyme Elp3 [Candidatus Woesearchaeota archaeon]